MDVSIGVKIILETYLAIAMAGLFLFLSVYLYDKLKDTKHLLDVTTARLNAVSKKHETYDVKELMQDLLAGEALVRVTRISPNDVFLRSPKGTQ